MSPIEIVAAVFGVVCVALTIRRHMGCWPAGLIQVVLYVVVFYRARLYSDMALQVVYIALQIYGWYLWAKGKQEDKEVRVVRISRGEAALWAVVAAAGSAGLGWTMKRWTDASLPYWDATATVLSLIAQYLMGRKILESWLIWIAVDVLSIGIYAAKDLYVTLALYVLFLVMATAGFFEWKRSWTARAAAEPA
jgi:nicotinamide mononucleotide transporter